MKFLYAAAVLLHAFLGYAQPFLVDNNPTPLVGASVYSDIQAAHDASSIGDTIYIIPSATSYGDVIITKQLTIFGGGFNPDTDYKYVSELGIVYLNEGASKTVISGLKILDLRLAYLASTYNLDTIRITHCHIDQVGAAESGSTLRTMDSLVFINNVFGNGNSGNLTGGYVDLVKAEITINKTYFLNNVFVGSTGNFGSVSADTAVFYNNLFFGQGAILGATSFYEVTRSTFANNVFFGRAPSSTLTLSNSYFYNNISSDSTFNSVLGTAGNNGSGNLNYTDPIMVNVSLETSYDLTSNLNISVGSPAKDAGTDGTDLGPGGGSLPFDPTGTPLPVVTDVNMPSIVVEGNNSSINVKAKGN